MKQMYEYKFVRLSEHTKGEEYQAVVLEHTREGWRLVQIFAPGAGGRWGKANYCEVILERESEG